MFAEAQTLPITLGPGVSAVTARVETARDRLASLSGTRDYADLPHQHARCGARWSGNITAHCAGCCETFSGVSTFDTHRDGKPGDNRYPPGRCYYPGDCGLVLAPGRAYRCWGTPPAPAEAVPDA